MRSFVILFFLTAHISFSQNLISNGDFEKGTPLTDLVYILDSVEHWQGFGSPDYFSVDSPYPVSVFNNYFGFQQPHSGKSYCGFYAGRPGASNVHELIYTEMKSPLIKDSLYYLSFYISLGDYMTHRSNSIGVLFSQELFFETDYREHMVLQRIIRTISPMLISDSVVLSNDQGWAQILVTYKAKGEERYLFLGGFDDKKGSNAHARERTSKPDRDVVVGKSYYFIDDVFLSKQKIEKDTTIINSSFNFETITFQKNSFELTEASMLVLDPFIQYIKRMQPSEIYVTGFTDAIGTKTLNKELSLKRADSVKKYLIKNGISEGLIKTYGGNDTNINATRSVKIEIKN